MTTAELGLSFLLAGVVGQALLSGCGPDAAAAILRDAADRIDGATAAAEAEAEAPRPH